MKNFILVALAGSIEAMTQMEATEVDGQDWWRPWSPSVGCCQQCWVQNTCRPACGCDARPTNVKVINDVVHHRQPPTTVVTDVVHHPVRPQHSHVTRHHYDHSSPLWGRWGKWNGNSWAWNDKQDYCNAKHTSDRDLIRAKHELSKAKWRLLQHNLQAAERRHAHEALNKAKDYLHHTLHWRHPCNIGWTGHQQWNNDQWRNWHSTWGHDANVNANQWAAHFNQPWGYDGQRWRTDMPARPWGYWGWDAASKLANSNWNYGAGAHPANDPHWIAANHA